MKLGVITPFKNEGKTIEVFIKSVIKQEDCDYRWLLINDGSTDNGVQIAEKLIQGRTNISIINREKTPGERKTGSNVVDIIYEGVELLQEEGYKYDVILKIDADLEIDDDNYFSGIMSKFKSNTNLYIASGAIYNIENENKILETKYLWHTQGQTKFYRKEFLDEIGLKRMTGWDGIDDTLAIEHGKKTRVFDQFMIRHFYKTRTRDDESGIWGGYQREALGYVNRYYPLYMFLMKAFKFGMRKPFLLGGMYFLAYSIKYKFNHEKILTDEEIKMVKRFCNKRLFGKIR